jgi:hypothetical protein
VERIPVIIFADVDGVLNPDHPHEDNKVILAKPEGYTSTFTLNLSPRQGEMLRELASGTGADLVWCTTWQQHANAHVGAHIGLPEMPHVPLIPGNRSESLGRIKARCALKYAGGRRFVIFDDEPDIGEYLGGHGMHMHVDARLGLLPEHIAAAREFLTTRE